MKREIKFKAKRLDGKGWVVGYGICVLEDYTLIFHKQGINLMQSTEVNPETVCQFTGLLDKDGKEI